MLQSSAECLSPEDIATIVSGSMSFMNDDNGDVGADGDEGEGSTHSYSHHTTTSASASAATTNTSTANNTSYGTSNKAGVVGGSAGIAFEDTTSTAPTTTSSTPIATPTTATATATTTDNSSTASSKERNEKIKLLNDAAAKKKQDHKKEVRIALASLFTVGIDIDR